MANTLKIKRGTAATIPQGQLAEPLFTTDTYDLYIGKGSGGNQRIQNYIASGTSSQFLKGDGSLDSTTYQATSEKGQNNGYASLDAGGKVPAAQLPNSVMEYKGTWNASTNNPTLADGTGNAGDVYIVSVGGTQNLGNGSITFEIGDWVMYNGAIWQKSTSSNAVVSVNGQTGIVSIGVNDLDDATITSPSNGQLLQYSTGTNKWVNWTPTYISAAITSLNGLTGATQTFATGTTGTDFNISSTTSTHTFNLPTASATNRGALSSADWTTFNNKMNNPMTTLGDIIFGGTSGNPNRLAGNTTTTKQYLSQTGTGTDSASPTWATITGSDITGAALTKSDDTNVTLTLGGTPATALLRAASLTLGWTGQLSIARGGTGLSALGTAGQLLRVNTGATALEYFTPTYISAAITSLNGLTAATQTFATGTTGTDFNISSTTSTHTFNIPSASATNRGLVTTSTQTFAGNKTFNGDINANTVLSRAMSGSAINIQGDETLNSEYGITWTTPTYNGGIAAIRAARRGATDAADLIFYTSINGDTPKQKMSLLSDGHLLLGETSQVYLSRFTLSYNPATTNGPIWLDNRSFASGRGAIQYFGGKYNTAGNYRAFGGVAAFKENGTDGDSSGYLAFYTNSNAADPTSKITISSSGLFSGIDALFTGDIRSNGTYRDYQGEALIGTNTSAVTSIGSTGAATPRSLQFNAGNSSRLTISTTGLATFTNSVSITSDLTVNTNTFYVDSTNNRVGILTVNPQSNFDIISPLNGYISIGRSLAVDEWSGIQFGYRENNTSYRKSAIVFERKGGSAQGRIHILNNIVNDISSATLSDSRLVIDESGNVIVGGTSSTFKFDVNGTGRFSDQLTANSFVPTSSTIPTNGMYLPAANTVAFAANSTRVIQISDSGRVSIGATTPTTDTLTVHGAITTTNGGTITAAGGLSTGSTINCGLNGIFVDSVSAAQFIPSSSTAQVNSMYLPAANTLGFSTATTLRLSISTTAITSTLPISGTSATFTGDIRSNGIYRDYQGEALLVTNTSAVTQLGSLGAGTPRSLQFNAGNASRLTISTTGTATFTSSVLTNNPSEGATGEGLIVGRSFKIDASGTSQSAKMYVVSNTLSDTYGSAFQIQFANFANTAGFGFNINTSGGYETYIKAGAGSWTKAMQINSGGETWINLSSISVNSARFASFQPYNSDSNTTTLSTQRTAGFFDISAGDNSNSQGSYCAIVARALIGASNNPGALFRGYAGTTYNIQINHNGNITNTNNSYGSLSDISLKQNIIDTTSKLYDLLKVRIVNYNLIGQEKKHLGVIAQELEKIFPSMIEHDADGLKSVKYSVFVPMLIKAIQEQQKQIEDLKSKLA